MIGEDVTIHPTPNTQHPTHNFALRFLRAFFKIFISSILAFTILTIACKFYNSSILASSAPADGVTDDRFEPNAFYSRFREGYSIGHFNNEGYNNLIDYEKGMKIEILLMGASHMEALHVMPEYNAANQLIGLSGKKIYNIGIANHFFDTCAANLEAAVKKYQPSEYVIIETQNVNFLDEVLNQILSNTKHAKERSSLRLFLRKQHFLLLLWTKAKEYFFPSRKDIDPTLITENNSRLLDEVLKRMSNTVSISGAKLIIAYHPPVLLNKDGTLKINADSAVIKRFSDLCNKNGIYFLDMSERFLKEYEKDYTLPYGFLNSKVAEGHMNKYGHKMFAEEIYKLIQRIEAK